MPGVHSRKRKARHAPVSLGGVVFESSLPLPWVNYPNHYGTFFGFAEKQKGPWFLCQCTVTPLTHLVQLNRDHPDSNGSHRAPLDNHHVPDVITAVSLKYRDDPIAALQFKPKLCHRCNMVQPTQRYCHEMYGGRFDQTFGWYVNQSRLRYGVRDYTYLSEVCPEPIRALVDAVATAQRVYEAKPTATNSKELNHAFRLLKNEFINVTRAEFGFRKIGEGWVSEMMMGNIVNRLFPKAEMLRHHRPNWLEGLELDVFLPAHSLGLEYQGQQHFHAIKAWGGKDALVQVQARDRRKAELCRRNKIALVHINYTDPITEEFIAEQIARAGVK
ncbi:MAG TPA: hypothetical protein VNU49_08450 [Opitutaceae bacterium]|nr:hypothetical protein [Opitutaceae bacterium]